MERPRQFLEWTKLWWRRAIIFVEATSLIIIAFAAITQASSSLGFGIWGMMLLGPVMIALGTVSIFFHEIGHAIAAWVSKWRVHLIVVGILAFMPQQKKFEILREYQSEDFGGFVLATPDEGQSWNQGHSLYVLGGALGNLALFFICIAIASQLYENNMPAFALVLGLGEISLVMGIFNLVPIWLENNLKNDGASLIDALQGKQPDQLAQHKSRLLGMYFDGIRIVDWDISVINFLSNVSVQDRKPIEQFLISFAICVYDFAAAKFFLEERIAFDDPPPAHYLSQYSYVVGRTDKDGERALEILDQVPDSQKVSYIYWLALSVSQHLLGNREQAITSLKKAKDALKKEKIEIDDEDNNLFIAIESGKPLPEPMPKHLLMIPARLNGGVEAA